MAATFTVKKTKGNNSVIESSVPLVPGETYTIQSSKQSAVSEDVSYTRSNRSRQNSFSGGIDTSFFKSDTLQEHEIDIEARYGWNFADYEVGPLMHINLIDRGAGFNTDYSVGGYFDYNFISNVASEDQIFGLTAQGYAGNREFTSGSSSQISALGGGGFYTWFLMRSTTSLRFEGLVERKTIATSVASSNVFGFAGKMLLAFYF
ncbi:hypothetical protein CIK05_06730 [Bdellovibrio sp. qaytius]|nr:hypothetical protein CIK05_06730 [Bdellovibrio sp. qaytius]